MKKRILCLAMTMIMVVGAGMTVNAKDYQGKDGWLVNFADGKMQSNFESSDISDDASNVQPGDSITLKVQIKNSESGETDWYMTNEVLQTLEDAKDSADGGGYEYRLSYVDASGNEDVIYDSETVGGDTDDANNEGLREATDSLEDYFYLDRLASGETGNIYLRLAVDGETQGNGYQETFATLRMNFAVEEVAEGTTTTKRVVKTGDTSNAMLFSALALASGVVLLVLGLKTMNNKKRTRRKGE